MCGVWQRIRPGLPPILRVFLQAKVPGLPAQSSRPWGRTRVGYSKVGETLGCRTSRACPHPTPSLGVGKS